MLTPERVVDIVLGDEAGGDGQLNVYWWEVPDEREDRRAQVAELGCHRGIIPIIVRDRGFDSPNCLLADLVELVDRSRTEILQHGIAGTGIVHSLVLLSKMRLAVPQVSSPAFLPDWFPRYGGRHITCLIKSVDWEVGVPLSATEVQRESISAELFELEGLMLKRLSTTCQLDKNAIDQFMQLIQTDGAPDERFNDFLVGATKCHEEVKEARGFRPSVRDATSLIARLLLTYLKTTPDGLTKAGRKLAVGLGCGPELLGVSQPFLFLILFRPTGRECDPCEEFGRRVLIATHAAYQLTTAAAHADAYPRFPVALLRSVAADVLSQLRGLRFQLKG